MNGTLKDKVPFLRPGDRTAFFKDADLDFSTFVQNCTFVWKGLVAIRALELVDAAWESKAGPDVIRVKGCSLKQGKLCPLMCWSGAYRKAPKQILSSLSLPCYNIQNIYAKKKKYFPSAFNKELFPFAEDFTSWAATTFMLGCLWLQLHRYPWTFRAPGFKWRKLLGVGCSGKTHGRY